MAAFIKNLSRFLGHSAKPAIHLAAFGKHPAWIDHLDDLGLDTEPLVIAKRLLYTQGMGQNIDSGAWESLETTPASAPCHATGRLDFFRHDFLWNMPGSGAGGGGTNLMAGRFWSSTDAKGRDKYPMVLCAQLTDLPDTFAFHIAMPQLKTMQDHCVKAHTVEEVQQIMQADREQLRSHLRDHLPQETLTTGQLTKVSRHPDLKSAEHAHTPEGFHRIAYRFLGSMSAFRSPPSRGKPHRPEQVRLPLCGQSPTEALLFWRRFALLFLDPATPIVLLAPDDPAAPWVDLIAGEPASTHLFCIKAGTKSIPFTSDIPYTLSAALTRSIDDHLAHCASLPPDSPVAPWPATQ